MLIGELARKRMHQDEMGRHATDASWRDGIIGMTCMNQQRRTLPLS